MYGITAGCVCFFFIVFVNFLHTKQVNTPPDNNKVNLVSTLYVTQCNNVSDLCCCFEQILEKLRSVS